MTKPRLRSSRFKPRTRAPRLSPASALSRLLWNISMPRKEKRPGRRIKDGGKAPRSYKGKSWSQPPGSQGIFPVPVTTVRMFLLCPRNSHSSPFFRMPRSSVPVTTVPRPGKKQNTTPQGPGARLPPERSASEHTVLTRNRINRLYRQQERLL